MEPTIDAPGEFLVSNETSLRLKALKEDGDVFQE